LILNSATDRRRRCSRKNGREYSQEWFDFGDDWYHQVRVERIEQAIPTVTYPRIIGRVGKSPPQYCDE
jgi:hypothetical protein